MVTSGHVTKMAVTIWSAVSETPYATYANFTFLSSTEPELGLLQIEVFHLHVYIKVPNGDSWPVSVCRTAGMPIMAHCQPYADHLDLALRPHFLSSTFAGSAIMLAICFRLPLTERRRSDCLLFTLLLHHHRCFSDRRTVKWYFGNISHKQIIALSLFTRRRRVARSANYPGHGPDARSLQRNAIRRATDQSSVHRGRDYV